MSILNRVIVLNTLIKHETLTIGDFAKEAYLNMTPSENHLQLLIDELVESGYIGRLNGVTPNTYTITDKGIQEGARLAQAQGETSSLRRAI